MKGFSLWQHGGREVWTPIVPRSSPDRRPCTHAGMGMGMLAGMGMGMLGMGMLFDPAHTQGEECPAGASRTDNCCL